MGKLFVRIDEVGTWKGQDHKSFFGEISEEGYENGISCYEVKAGWAESLYSYWANDVYNTDSENRQLTIFQGYLIGKGSSMEDLATCKNTIIEIPSSILFDTIEFLENVEEGYEYYDEDEEEEISLDDEIFCGMDKFEIVEKVVENMIR